MRKNFLNSKGEKFLTILEFVRKIVTYGSSRILRIDLQSPSSAFFRKMNQIFLHRTHVNRDILNRITKVFFRVLKNRCFCDILFDVHHKRKQNRH
ncbi:hypothetical protein LEP1GSC108_0405 [Leptospira weilii str. UI 13098]|uniref:Uncharacterized protein n=1 Tax=Leptospira weilii str. UI 13098 TaxID=1088542 RepID=M6Q1P1_9LEPT|nr:hypothetical protein LEP1GSC108_0405 [Leptospira weilii str. UI 13098]